MHYMCMSVSAAGALERNLVPLVASDIPPDVKPRPVEVAVSGVAFPHPEKVRAWLSSGVVGGVCSGNVKGCGRREPGWAAVAVALQWHSRQLGWLAMV